MRHYIIGTAATLLLYYALFLYLGMILVEHCSLPLVIALLIPLFLFLLQYLLFPKIADGICSPIEWQKDDTPYPEIKEVLEGSKNKGLLKPPAWGISPSPFPAVFTYGHHRGNCRIILSSGLCEVLSPEERKCIIAHELNHITTGDFLSIMCTGLLPLLLFLFSWNILLVGIGLRQLKSTRTLALFGLILWGISKILYFMLYFASRAREYMTILQSAEDRVLYDTALAKIIKAQSECIVKNENGLKRALALNFLGNMDPWRSFRDTLDSPSPAAARNDGLFSDNPWNSYFELFFSHPLQRIQEIPAGEKKKGSARTLLFTKEMVLYALPLMSLIVLIFVPHFHLGSIGGAILLWGFTFSLVLAKQYPRIKPSSAADISSHSHISALSGTPMRLKGILTQKEIFSFFPHLLFLQCQDMELPAEIKALSPAENIYDDMHIDGEVEISGWLRRNPYNYIEVKEIRRSSRKKIFSSQYILCKFFIAYGSIFLGLFLMILQQREG